jgi:Zn-dependent protease
VRGEERGVGRGLRVGAVLGIPIWLDLSWFAGLAFFALVTHGMWAPRVTGAWALGLSLAFTLAFFGSLLLHELCHALAAAAIGVPTAEITLYVFGGAARIVREPPDAGSEALMAMAGPLASVTLAGVLALAAQLAGGWAGDLLTDLSLANLVLAVFNLLPGFPLDGGRVLRALLWRASGRRLLATRVTAWLGRGLGALLALAGLAATVRWAAPRFLLNLVLGLFLVRAAGEGERAARRAEEPAGDFAADAVGPGRGVS